MPNPLPPASDFNSAATQLAFQQATTALIAFLTDMLGTDGVPATARALLDVAQASTMGDIITRNVGITAGQVPLIDNLGALALLGVGSGLLSTGGNLAVDLAKGLEIVGGKVQVKLGSGLQFNVSDAIELAAGVFTAGPYESADQTIVPGGLISLTHGLGGTPTLLQTRVKCVSADAGYSVNDLLYPENFQDFNGGSRGYGPRCTSSQVLVRVGSDTNPLRGLRGDTGADQIFDETKWRLQVRVWR